ncbi:glycoside hydrolase family 15 protein [Corynebacterium sp. A21]|uniref:glycoside hydrolase family 15 protein n=1 Tax=Corynebacterium sp. A21 TaxID=3457318 RepID=UPI003FD33B20
MTESNQVSNPVKKISQSTPLEDYALLSDLHTGPLISREGSIDWLCLPRFDSDAIFTAILGTPDDGRWKMSIVDGRVTSRNYRGNTFILETYWEGPNGTARVTDFMPPGNRQADLIRYVECLSGEVEIEHDMRVRFSYARVEPWFRPTEVPGSEELGLLCTAGPDGVLISGPLLHQSKEFRAEDGDVLEASGAPAKRLTGTFRISEGETESWTLTWFRPWRKLPIPEEPLAALWKAESFWEDWLRRLDTESVNKKHVVRSLLVLRALTHRETGGIAAAATASLPEDFGGVRNWDYRFTWLRDASLTVEVMVSHGLINGAAAWRDWLLRAVAGDPERLQIMYGIGGERQLPEQELDHLAGYENSRPVRIGNGAADQYQADVVGEVMLALAKIRDAGYPETPYSWNLQVSLLDYNIANFDRKDHGIWEMRGELHYFTHGRVMMWAAFNEGIRAVREHGFEGDVETWTRYRDRLHDEIFERGFNQELNSFTQVYDGIEVDASLLQLPHTRFIAPEDPKMLGTVAKIEQDLVDEYGLVFRYRTEAGLDGLEGDEYPFLICAFWLVEQYAVSGRLEEAKKDMTRLCSYANDLGLLAEEYDPKTKRLAGNFPQAFSHLALIRAADAITRMEESSD